MRIVLEGWAIKRATLRLLKEDLDEMERLLIHARQDAVRSRFDSHLSADLAIHGMIVRSGNNKLFDRLIQLVSDRSIRIRTLTESIAPVERVLQIISEHLTLLEAVRSRNPEVAHQSLMAHLEAGMVRTLSALEEIRTGDV
jgi:DNA-binding GntR family transcriptional regulator